MGTLAFSWPTHVAAQTCRVHPSNHTSAESLVVPVFPKTGHVPRLAAVPVPPVTTRRSIPATSSATSASTTWRQRPFRWPKPGTGRLLLWRTRVMATGSQCTPWLANVVNAEAISNGVTSSTPSVTVQYGSRWLSMPIRWAASTILGGPTSIASWTNTALIDEAVAVSRLTKPELPSALNTL